MSARNNNVVSRVVVQVSLLSIFGVFCSAVLVFQIVKYKKPKSEVQCRLCSRSLLKDSCAGIELDVHSTTCNATMQKQHRPSTQHSPFTSPALPGILLLGPPSSLRCRSLVSKQTCSQFLRSVRGFRKAPKRKVQHLATINSVINSINPRPKAAEKKDVSESRAPRTTKYHQTMEQ